MEKEIRMERKEFKIMLDKEEKSEGIDEFLKKRKKELKGR